MTSQRSDTAVINILGIPVIILLFLNPWLVSFSIRRTQFLFFYLHRLVWQWISGNSGGTKNQKWPWKQQNYWILQVDEWFEVNYHPLKVAQLCPTLCDTIDHRVHGILQARILEWVAVPFSKGSSQPRDRTQFSCIVGGFFTIWATREAQEYWSG